MIESDWAIKLGILINKTRAWTRVLRTDGPGAAWSIREEASYTSGHSGGRIGWVARSRFLLNDREHDAHRKEWRRAL